jgi:hypothetical protein
MPVKVAKNNLYIYLVILLVAFICLVLYQSYTYQSVSIIESNSTDSLFIPSQNIGGVSTKYLPEVIVDKYGPPLRNDQPPIVVDFVKGYPRNSIDERGSIPINPIYNLEEGLTEIIKRELVPINIETRGIPREFTQVGILKTNMKNENNILSLFGRQLMTSGDKWQYYTLSNVGIMPTRLPIRVLYNGRQKDAMYEYGVDRLYNDDIVIVDGYDSEYIVQIYEPRQYRYI